MHTRTRASIRALTRACAHTGAGTGAEAAAARDAAGRELFAAAVAARREADAAAASEGTCAEREGAARRLAPDVSATNASAVPTVHPRTQRSTRARTHTRAGLMFTPKRIVEAAAQAAADAALGALTAGGRSALASTGPSVSDYTPNAPAGSGDGVMQTPLAALAGVLESARRRGAAEFSAALVAAAEAVSNPRDGSRPAPSPSCESATPAGATIDEGVGGASSDEELRECSFTPVINKRSRLLASGRTPPVPDVPDVVREGIKAAAERMHRAREVRRPLEEAMKDRSAPLSRLKPRRPTRERVELHEYQGCEHKHEDFARLEDEAFRSNKDLAGLGVKNRTCPLHPRSRTRERHESSVAPPAAAAPSAQSSEYLTASVAWVAKVGGRFSTQEEPLTLHYGDDVLAAAAAFSQEHLLPSGVAAQLRKVLPRRAQAALADRQLETRALGDMRVVGHAATPPASIRITLRAEPPTPRKARAGAEASERLKRPAWAR